MYSVEPNPGVLTASSVTNQGWLSVWWNCVFEDVVALGERCYSFLWSTRCHCGMLNQKWGSPVVRERMSSWDDRNLHGSRNNHRAFTVVAQLHVDSVAIPWGEAKSLPFDHIHPRTLVLLGVMVAVLWMDSERPAVCRTESMLFQLWRSS